MVDWLASITLGDVALVGAGIIGGGIVSYFVARRFIHRPNLKFNLHQAAVLNRADFGNKFRMSVDGNDIHNLCVFNLDMTLSGSADLAPSQVPSDNKPSLYMPGFAVYDVRTIDYDESRFRIPLGIAGNGSLILINLERMRAGTTARFQILGSFRDSDDDASRFAAEFYPGAVHNVDMKTSGMIKRPWKKTKDQRSV